MKKIKPKILRPGSRIAAISLSWGGPGTVQYRYEIGKQQFEEEFDVTVVETAHALRDADWLAKNPEARADDLMAAFADETIDGIISTIGGEDSIRTLPHLDLDLIRKNPKVFMGFSDTTISHAACFKAGIVSFYGPSFMAGFAENGGMFPYMVDSVRRALFSAEPIGVIEPNRTEWTVEYLPWETPENQSIRRKLNPCEGWRFHQTDGSVEGQLFGGCVDVLDWLRGTDYFSAAGDLQGAVLFLETSEEGLPPSFLTRFVRCLAAMDILEGLNGILLGRPGGGVDPDTFAEYDDALCKTIREEYGLNDMPIVTNMDFGHTDPMFVIPIGMTVRIDSAKQEIAIDEAAVIDV
ncbi:LD-carboxypeptidase [Candidatus Poribacteria bacterium]|nr:LD-carboxypeptidase [Candidatus Poribacteria bacterium]MYA98742.1 LD-carboxypeptidase [Candidatus Poribacteria bacterium]